MNIAKQLFRFYIVSSFHVALAVTSLTWATFLELQLPYSSYVLTVAFLVSFVGYNFVKYVHLIPLKNTFSKNLLWILGLSLISVIALLFFLFHIDYRSLTVLFISFGITFLYTIPVFNNGRNLRSVGLFKIFAVSLCWVLITTIFPVAYYDLPYNTNILTLCLQRFLFVLALILPFEIQDIDRDVYLTTLPKYLGIRKTKITGGFSLLIFCFLLPFRNFVNPYFFGAYIGIAIITGLFILFTPENSNRLYSVFWVEGLPIFFGGMLWIAGF